MRIEESSENRTFDHVFATYKPKSGDSVRNLLSEGIIKADGTPGPHFYKAAQFQALKPFKIEYFISWNKEEKAPYTTLSAPTLNFSPSPDASVIGIQPLDFFGDGPRIPLIIVSPFTKGGHINHTYTGHVSILKFIERNWDLKPLTHRSRDNFPNPIVEDENPYVPTNSPALGDLFDFFHFGRDGDVDRH